MLLAAGGSVFTSRSTLQHTQHALQNSDLLAFAWLLVPRSLLLPISRLPRHRLSHNELLSAQQALDDGSGNVELGDVYNR